MVWLQSDDQGTRSCWRRSSEFPWWLNTRLSEALGARQALLTLHDSTWHDITWHDMTWHYITWHTYIHTYIHTVIHTYRIYTYIQYTHMHRRSMYIHIHIYMYIYRLLGPRYEVFVPNSHPGRRVLAFKVRINDLAAPPEKIHPLLRWKRWVFVGECW